MSSDKELLGIDIKTCRNCIEFQMCPEMNWKNFHINHVKPNFLFVVSKDEELGEAFISKKNLTVFEIRKISKR